MSEQTVLPEDQDFVDASSGLVLRFVDCARCQKTLMGENTKDKIKEGGDVSLLTKFDHVGARIGGRPFCGPCVPMAATPIGQKKRGRPRKSFTA